MTHFMKLSPEAFAAFKNGGKRVEMRLFDEKRQKIRAGDEIIFGCPQSGRIKVTVEGLKTFENFSALYACCSARELGYKEGDCPRPEDMNAYYSLSEQKKYGVLAIETGAPQEVL